MRNRLIAVILCLFGMVAGGHATPNVTAEITYDLAAGRADYYFWNREDPPAVECVGPSNSKAMLMRRSGTRVESVTDGRRKSR